MFFLFSDMLIYARPNLGSSRYVRMYVHMYAFAGLGMYVCMYVCMYTALGTLHISLLSPPAPPSGHMSVAVCSLCSTPLYA